MSKRLGFRHCDPRFPFLWQTTAQPAARWHGDGDGPANYFCDTPVGAWAEFLRHEGITDAADLAGVRRSLWVAELPDSGYVSPSLPDAVLFGDESKYPECQREARRLRAGGAERLEARGAALLPGAARGWKAWASARDPSPQPGGSALQGRSAQAGRSFASPPPAFAPQRGEGERDRDGLVWVLFGACDVTGWIAVDAGSPPALALPLVRPLVRPPPVPRR